MHYQLLLLELADRLLLLQLIGEVVGLVMAPIIFYYLYYQVHHAVFAYAWQLGTQIK